MYLILQTADACAYLSVSRSRCNFSAPMPCERVPASGLREMHARCGKFGVIRILLIREKCRIRRDCDLFFLLFSNSMDF